MYVDVMTVPQSLAKISGLARQVQNAGFSGLLFTETGRTAYLNAAVASQAAPGLDLSHAGADPRRAPLRHRLRIARPAST